MIFYSFPPRGGVGAFRTIKFAKFLSRFGWEAVILTPENAPSQVYSEDMKDDVKGISVLKTGYFDIFNNAGRSSVKKDSADTKRAMHGKCGVRKSFKSILKSLIAIPDEQIGWYRPAVTEALEVCKAGKIDLIYSSSPPETSHLIACAIKKRTGIPWVADLRDPWADYHHTGGIFIRNFINKILERNTLKYADRIITVSEKWSELFGRHYPGKVSLITNGYDEEDFDPADSKEERFTITYAGKMHRDKQSPELFFKALHGLIREGSISEKDIQIKFYTYGNNQPDFEDIKKRYGLEKVLKVMPRIDYKKCLNELAGSSMLLLADWGGSGEISLGVIPAKVFDYIGARKRILLLSAKADSDLCKIIKNTNSGVICSNETDIKRAVWESFDNFKKGKQFYNGNTEEIKKYTRYNLTKDLSDIFNICKKGAS